MNIPTPQPENANREDELRPRQVLISTGCEKADSRRD
jgi:hypothetical protein